MSSLGTIISSGSDSSEESSFLMKRQRFYSTKGGKTTFELAELIDLSIYKVALLPNNIDGNFSILSYY